MMKLMTLKQYMSMSKPALIRKITKALRAMPKVKLARLCYNITKSKLPRLRKYKTFPRRPSLGVREKMPDEEIYFRRRLSPKRKTKRKKLTPKEKKARISLWNMLTPEEQKQIPLKRMLSF